MKEIRGVINAVDISAAITQTNTITASIQRSEGPPRYETYNGEYEATPKNTAQVMDTKYKLMKDNFTVKQIPYYEVTNTANGKTVTIGG